MSNDEEVITSGTVNKARTRYKCFYCEGVFLFDPSWKSIGDIPESCPGCVEFPFYFVCEAPLCEYQSHCSPRPSTFHDQICAECSKTSEESTRDQEEEEAEDDAYRKEHQRMELAKAHRERVQKGIHENRIMHTYKTMYGESQDPYNPTSIEDAFRMTEHDFARLRPLIENELRLRNLDLNTCFTMSCCKGLISFFERSWLDENKEGLNYGVTEDLTGRMHNVFRRESTPLHIRLRGIREDIDEGMGIFPSTPSVMIIPVDPDDTLGSEALTVIWDENENDMEEDSCPNQSEIYRKDGITTLTFPEFLVWIARTGGLGDIPENPKYSPTEDLGMPPDYVPSDWVGKPKHWEVEKTDGFGRWFWMREEVSRSKGQISIEDLIVQSRKNMMRCCHCYGLPSSDDVQDLISCRCKNLLFCSEECKIEVMKVHKYNCLNALECALCLKSNTYTTTKLVKCGRCKKVAYCDVDCQRQGWKNGHKRNCVAIH